MTKHKAALHCFRSYSNETKSELLICTYNIIFNAQYSYKTQRLKDKLRRRTYECALHVHTRPVAYTPDSARIGAKGVIYVLFVGPSITTVENCGVA